MRVLVACEESQVVCKAFRERGHEAYSCDILPTSGNHPQWHYRCDVKHLLGFTWDMVIAFPPCTNLAVSGARWFNEKRANGSQQKSIDFFKMFTNLDCRWSIENPVGIMSRLYRKPDQIIQPWQFGHKETKATCLWLNGLAPLKTTDLVGPPPDVRKMDLSEAMSVRKEWNKCHRQPPGPDRAKLRSKTYLGIAKAMAEQWG